MNCKTTNSRYITALLCAAFTLSSACAHDHYAAGIVDVNNNGQPDAGEPLQFVGANGTNKVFHLLARPVGQRPIQRCGGYYMLDERPRTNSPRDSFSFIALSDGQFDVASAGHAHTGAWIWMEITSVSGPAGAHFGFWDENWSEYYDTPTVSFATNEPTGGYKFILGEGINSAGEDPSGHIHGRAWTADKPGDYIIGFTLYDLSTNAPGGGPWHPPSQVYYYHFKAGPSFLPTMSVGAGGSRVLTWPSQLGYWASDPAQTGISFTIERSSTLAAGSWQSIGTVMGTTANTATFTDTAPPVGRAFYRLSYQWATPAANRPFLLQQQQTQTTQTIQNNEAATPQASPLRRTGNDGHLNSVRAHQLQRARFWRIPGKRAGRAYHYFRTDRLQ